MTQVRADRVSDRDRGHMLLIALAVSVVASVLLWTLWVLPTSRSVAEAQVAESGSTLVFEADAGQRVGVWTENVAHNLGTFTCVADGPAAVSSWRGPSLTWDDTLWWMTGRTGYEQYAQLFFSESGTYTLSCADERDVYDGGFVIAADVFGGFGIGLGRQGAVDFPVGTVLAVSAVVAPLFVILFPIVLLLRAMRGGRRRETADSPRDR